MTRTAGRVVIPQNPKDKLELARAVFSKHITEGGASPLLQLRGVEIGLTSSKIEPALAQHEIAENLKREMEQAYRERDAHMNEIMDLTRKSIKLLKAIYADNPKKLGEWGVNVDDSTQPKKKKTIDTPKE